MWYTCQLHCSLANWLIKPVSKGLNTNRRNTTNCMKDSVVSFVLHCALIVDLCGPTSAGKGYLGKLLMLCHYFEKWGKKPLNIVVIALGDLVRERIKHDAVFAEEYCPLLARGDLLPNRVVYHLLEEALEKLASHTNPREIVLVIDGLGRNGKQIRWGKEHHVFGPTTMSIVLNASRATCLERFLHRNTNQAPRMDSEITVFNRRYREYDDGLIGLINGRREVGCRVFQVNANGPLEAIPNRIYPDVVSFITSVDLTAAEKQVTHPIHSSPLNVVQPPAIHPGAIPQPLQPEVRTVITV